MSDSSDASDFSDDDTKQHTQEMTAPAAPRIKLKLRLNPSASSSALAHPTAESDDDGSHRKRKKHKSKKKKSHKKRKKQRSYDTDDEESNGCKRQKLQQQYDTRPESDNQLSIDDEEYSNASITEDYDQEATVPAATTHHVSVGSKRPFAMLQTVEEGEEGEEGEEEKEDNYEDDYEDDASLADSYQHQQQQMDNTGSYGSGYIGQGSATYTTDARMEGLLNDHTTIKSELMDQFVHPTDSAALTTSAGATHITANAPTCANRGRKPKMIPTLPVKGEQKPKKRGRPAKSKVQPKPEPRVVETPKKDMKTVCTKLLDTFEKRDAYGFFLQPVDTSIVRDYLTVIKHPMDFSTMRRKLQSGLYLDVDAFKADFVLIVTNAKTYNAPDTIYYKSADRLEQYGVKAIERAERSIVYGSPQPEDEVPPYTESHLLSSRRQSSMSVSRKDSNVKIEEEVDILGLDNPSSYTISARKTSRQDMDVGGDMNSSRAATPTRGSSKKKKKKKVTDAGIVYAPDGSLAAVGGVADLTALIPPERRFADLPEVTTANIHALPSAFFTSRSTYEEWSNNKHIVNPASFCDYGAFTALGEEAPGAFYTAQDACYIYPLYGDDRGEAYMRSLWEFVDDLDLKDLIDDKSRYLTRGAWDVLKQALKGPENCQDVDTEFGTVHKADFKQAYSSVMEDKPATTS